MILLLLKSHPATQAMSGAAKPADLNEPGLRRNPGEPSAEQAEADTYNKPRIQWQGLTIAIENPAGSVRRGRNRHGVSWEIRMRFDYGEIVGSMGVDGDPVDVYMGPNPDAPMVYVVHQRRVNDWTEYDEDKCMVGFDSQEDAEAAFLSNYNDPRFLGQVTAMPVAEFVAKVRATKEAPAMIKAAAPVVLFFKAHVGPYLRGGKLVNVSGYQGRSARAAPQPGQMSLFGSNKPLPPSPLKGKDPVASTPDMFSEHPPEKVAWAKKVISNRDYMPWQDVKEAHKVLGIKDEDAEWASQKIQSAKKKDTITEPRSELIKEHERLVDVLNSASHEDDKVEAKRQAKELAEMKQEDTQALKDRLQTLHDFLEVNPSSPSAPVWKEKIAEIEAKIGPLKSAKAEAPKNEVDTSGWSDPHKAAYALRQEYAKLDKLDNKAVGAFKTKIRALAKKTPADDAGATLIIDGMVNNIWGTDYNPKVAGVEFAPARAETAAGSIGPNPGLYDGTTIRDGNGNQYRVHYNRNSLIVAHPIVDGKPQVSATTSVRFWTNPDQTPAGENDRTDPVFVVDAPKPAKPTEDLEPFIKVAADSVKELRKVDVMRVLQSNGTRKFAIARYIEDQRPDLAQEVKEVMEDEFGHKDWRNSQDARPLTKSIVFLRHP